MSILTSIVIIITGIACIGALLGMASIILHVKSDPIIDKIESLLPQTQCGQCSYPGCKPYAKAIADGEDINKCPPGGQATIDALADLLGRETTTLDAEHGESKPQTVAVIREDECIGCTKCIQACPVDAILGAAKQMHTVITTECTGCDLCVDPCPVDCIDMVTVPADNKDLLWPLPQTGKVVTYNTDNVIAISN